MMKYWLIVLAALFTILYLPALVMLGRNWLFDQPKPAGGAAPAIVKGD